MRVARGLLAGVLLALAALLAPSPARAQIACPTLPYTFVNGTVADAGQVNANFNSVYNCITTAAAAAHLATNNDLLLSSTVTYPQGVWRDNFAVGFHAPPLFYIGAAVCPHSNPVDNGACVTSADGRVWVAAFPADGVPATQFGVDPSQTAAVNTSALNAAAAAAYHVGLHLNLCVAGDTAVTVKTNGSYLYPADVDSCVATVYQRQVVGATFATLPSPASTTPGENWQVPMTIGNLHTDEKALAGSPLLIEGFWNVKVEHPVVDNMGSCTVGCWTHNDGVNATGSYPDALIVKGIAGVAGAYGVEIDNVAMFQPGFSPRNGATAISGGVGIWCGTTAGQFNTRGNRLRIVGGQIAGYAIGVKLSACGDVQVSNVDVSGNTWGVIAGGDVVNGLAPAYGTTTIFSPDTTPGGDTRLPVGRLTAINPYCESNTGALSYACVWFTRDSQGGRIEGFASVTAMAACIDDAVTAGFSQCEPQKNVGTPYQRDTVNSAGTTVYTPRAPDAGYFDVKAGGAGGAGGGCVAVDGTHNCVGGGGSAGGSLDVKCLDLKQLNFRGGTVTVGAGGAVGTGAGASGGFTQFTGALSLTNDWAALTGYTARSNTTPTSLVIPQTGNAGKYLYGAIVAGSSGAGAPTWPQTPGATVVDGTVTWENLGKTDWSVGMTMAIDAIDSLGNGRQIGTLIWPHYAQMTGNLTNGSAVVTALANTTNIKAGYAVTGTGVAGGATVLSVDSISQITMSAVATANSPSGNTFLQFSDGTDAGGFVYQAIQPGIAGGSAPTFPQNILASVGDGTGRWQAVGRVIFLRAGGGTGGPTSGSAAAAGQVALAPAGVNDSTIFGCAGWTSNGFPSSAAYLNAGIGWSGSGGSSVFGRGGLGVLQSSSPFDGNPGGPASGGGGTMSIGANASTQNGGAGGDGKIIIDSQAGAIPP